MHETIKKLLLLTHIDGGESGEQMEENGSEKREEQLKESNKRLEPTLIIVYELLQVRTKRRLKGNRLKPIRKLHKPRGGKCNECSQRGVKHDKINCPLVLDR